MLKEYFGNTGADSSAPDWKGNIIIFPGGGYQWLSDREGEPVAKAFLKEGWKPWIVSYPVSENGEVLGTGPLWQAADAVRAVRARFPEKPVVLCGFSAGAHVAASLGVHWNDRELFGEEEQRILRPDALVLSYPVITAGAYAHRGSMEKLAGDGDPGYFSLENYVTVDTPPTFLWHTAADQTVPVQNSLLFAQRLGENQVPFELHIFPYGVHGLSLATKEVEDLEKNRYADEHVARWFELCVRWLDEVIKK